MATAPIQQLDLISVVPSLFNAEDGKPYGITKKDLKRLLGQSRPYSFVDYTVLEDVCQGLVSGYNECRHDLDSLLSKLQPSEILALGWIFDFINVKKSNRREYDFFRLGCNSEREKLYKLFVFAWEKIYRGKTHLREKFLMIQRGEDRRGKVLSAVNALDSMVAESIMYFVESGRYTEGTLRREGETGRSFAPFVDDAHMFISQIRDGTIHPLKLHEKNPVYR